MAETNDYQVSTLKGSHKKSTRIRQVQNKYDKIPSPQWQQLHDHNYCKNPVAIEEVHVNPVGSATCSETHTSVESTIKEVNVTKPNSTECSEKQTDDNSLESKKCNVGYQWRYMASLKTPVKKRELESYREKRAAPQRNLWQRVK